jgi:hypothetical protein
MNADTQPSYEELVAENAVLRRNLTETLALAEAASASTDKAFHVIEEYKAMIKQLFDHVSKLEALLRR